MRRERGVHAPALRGQLRAVPQGRRRRRFAAAAAACVGGGALGPRPSGQAARSAAPRLPSGRAWRAAGGGRGGGRRGARQAGEHARRQLRLRRSALALRRLEPDRRVRQESKLYAHRVRAELRAVRRRGARQLDAAARQGRGVTRWQRPRIGTPSGWVGSVCAVCAALRGTELAVATEIDLGMKLERELASLEHFAASRLGLYLRIHPVMRVQ
eukprot:1526261-Prymnesium_polylepis.1